MKDLSRAVCEVYEPKLKSLETSAAANPVCEFSEEYKNQKENIMQKHKRLYISVLTSVGRRVACFTLALVALMPFLFDVDATQETALCFNITRYSNHDDICVTNELIMTAPKTVEYTYRFDNIADDFELIDYDATDKWVDYIYQKGETIIFISVQTKEIFSISYDNETTYTGKYTYDGQDYLRHTTEEMTGLSWDEGNYIISVYGNLKTEEMMELLESRTKEYYIEPSVMPVY